MIQNVMLMPEKSKMAAIKVLPMYHNYSLLIIKPILNMNNIIQVNIILFLLILYTTDYAFRLI